MNNTIVALDIAKNVFHSVRQNGQRKKLSRGQLLKFIAQLAPQRIAMEACAAAHHWGRCFEQYGHTVELYPPQHVKAYLRGKKNDYNGVEAPIRC